ncbi:MAG: thiamine-phosphate synthase family protein [Candidatus Hodarchaeales archaeon]
MQFMCEFIPSFFLTPLRRELALKLSSKGYKQQEIAQILGVSQPVISLYLKERPKVISPIVEKQAFKDLVQEIYDLVLTQSYDPLVLMEKACQECQFFRTAGPMCDIHRKKTSIDFPVNCKICFSSQERRVTFDDKLHITKELYQSACRLVDLGDSFTAFIPEIGCQFVAYVEDSIKGPDIIGFPGRIVKVKSTGKIISYPESGHGSTLAQILLYFRSRGSKYASLISLKNNPNLLAKLSVNKKVKNTFEADRDWDKTLNLFTLEEIHNTNIIADSGAHGLESLIYLFGESPSNIASYIMSCL